MRIATNQFQANMTTSLSINQTAATRLTQRMASGLRIELPSDDVVDSVRLSRLNREEAAIKQYRDNIAAIKLRLTRNEGYLQNMVNDMIGGRDLLVWAADGGNVPEDLNAMVTPLEALRESLLYNANTKDEEGRAVFGGTLTNVTPVAFDPAAPMGSRYTYVGNTGEQRVIVANGISQTGNENLQGIEDLLNKLDVAIDEMKQPGVDVNDPATRAKIKGALDGFDDAVNLLSGKIAVMGGSQNILSTLDANHANVSLSNKMAINEIGQLDMAKAATELVGYETALQATYKAYSRIGNLTLFSEI